MKPASFAYVRAESVPHALEALGSAGDEAKVLAGGQSLMPMINFRLVKPSVLVDINRIPGLDVIEDLGLRLKLGALVRHWITASDARIAEHVPVLHETMKSVAHMTVRNRGTFCGSVSHNDPAAEMPMITLLLDGAVHIASPNGPRTLPAAKFLTGPLTTALEPGELVTAIEIDKLAPGAGWGFEEFSRRHGDFALAAVAAVLERREGRATEVRVAIMGVGDTALRLPQAEAILEGSDMSAAVVDAAVEAIRGSLDPRSDLSASSDYRRHLSGVLAARVLKAAWSRAEELA